MPPGSDVLKLHLNTLKYSEMKYTTDDFQKVGKMLKSGKVGIIPTDTIYGIVGLALNPKVVEKIYQIRNRDIKKPMIILISNIEDLKQFNINLSKKEKIILQKNWPGAISVVINSPDSKFDHLQRGTKSLAFRIPDNQFIKNTLKISGPLVAPSANPQGEKPATTIERAKIYFGNKVDFYVDGAVENKPSTIVKLENNNLTLIRKGAMEIV